MTRRSFVVVGAAFVCTAMAAAAAQTAPQPQEERQKRPLDIVEVIGCLAEGPYNTWLLTRSTDPVVSNTNALTSEAIKEAEAKPLGSKEQRLVVVSEYDPWAHKGHKIVVRGILIVEGTVSRISVTALRRASVSCQK